jgi:hypothetical protein
MTMVDWQRIRDDIERLNQDNDDSLGELLQLSDQMENLRRKMYRNENLIRRKKQLLKEMENE